MKVAVKKHTSKWESHWKGERCLLGWHSEPGLLFQWRLSLSSTKFPVNSGVGSDSLLMILEYVFVALTFNQCIWVSEVRTSFSGSLKLSSGQKHRVWPDLKLAWGCSLKSWTPQIYNTFQEGGFFFSLSPFFWWFDKYDKDVLPLEGEMLEEDFGKRQVSAPTLVLPVLSLHPDPCYHVRDWLSQPRCCSAASGQGQMFGLEQSTWHTEIYKSLKRSCLRAQPLQSCLALCDPMNCSPPPGSSVHGILQVRILEGVAMPSSRWSSQPRNQTRISWVASGFFTAEPLGDISYKGSQPATGGYPNPHLQILADSPSFVHLQCPGFQIIICLSVSQSPR